MSLIVGRTHMDCSYYRSVSCTQWTIDPPKYPFGPSGKKTTQYCPSGCPAGQKSEGGVCIGRKPTAIEPDIIYNSSMCSENIMLKWSNAAGVIQTAYRVQVAYSPNFGRGMTIDFYSCGSNTQLPQSIPIKLGCTSSGSSGDSE